jgi:hypothetical protein
MNAGAARDGRQHCEAFCGVYAYAALKKGDVSALRCDMPGKLEFSISIKVLLR